ncbi:unnamed protein product [Rangifer tarandus platyrhynchus]|uniref:Uncharacterized protein n=1 Tax=Rangifer tarandus platyrhynchus TaxID=3082113 RepID=A0AC59ZS58_RANTA
MRPPPLGWHLNGIQAEAVKQSTQLSCAWLPDPQRLALATPLFKPDGPLWPEGPWVLFGNVFCGLQGM